MEWIKCSDKLPEKDETVLFYDGDEIRSGYLRMFEYYYSENKLEWHTNCDCRDNWEEYKPTHWMLLPEKPKGE